MLPLIPTGFRCREWLLAIVAAVFGLGVGAVMNFTLAGAYCGWILLHFLGACFFLAVGRKHRAFLVGVFGFTLFAFAAVGIGTGTWTDHKSLGGEYAIMMAILFLWIVVAPVSLGLLISRAQELR
jgi:hypothetical protein